MYGTSAYGQIEYGGTPEGAGAGAYLPNSIVATVAFGTPAYTPEGVFLPSSIVAVSHVGSPTYGETLPSLPDSFHSALATWIYPNLINRERVVLYGSDALLALYAVTPTGEEEVATLDDDWTARRIPEIEAGQVEQWRVEIIDESVDWNTLKYVTRVRMRGATDEEQIYEVLERYNAMKPGKVYHLRVQAIGNIDPS